MHLLTNARFPRLGLTALLALALGGSLSRPVQAGGDAVAGLDVEK